MAEKAKYKKGQVLFGLACGMFEIPFVQKVEIIGVEFNSEKKEWIYTIICENTEGAHPVLADTEEMKDKTTKVSEKKLEHSIKARDFKLRGRSERQLVEEILTRSEIFPQKELTVYLNRIFA